MVGMLPPSTRAVVFAHLRTMLGAAVDEERIAKKDLLAAVGTYEEMVVALLEGRVA